MPNISRHKASADLGQLMQSASRNDAQPAADASPAQIFNPVAHSFADAFDAGRSAFYPIRIGSLDDADA